jgi:signal transduction histidine kinase
VAAWFCEKRFGIFIAVLAGVVSLTADWLTGDPDLKGWTQPWEIARHLGSGLAVAFVGSALRTKHEIATARIALLERSQRLEREIVSISEAEQRRIGQDLHDGLCQHLAALSCAATSLRDDLKELHLRPEAATADDLAAQLREAVVQTRDLAHGLAPAHVSQVGIVLALQSLAQTVSRLQEIDCTFAGPDRLDCCDQATAIHLYRIAQEAINNATRHGRARNIGMTLSSVDDLITLRIADDGIGMGGNSLPGMGLAVMRYRARLNGGELRVEHPLSGGTIILCTARAKLPARPISEVVVA